MKKLFLVLAFAAGFCFLSFGQDNEVKELIAEYGLKYEAAQKEFASMPMILDEEKWAYVQAQATCLSYETMVTIGEQRGLNVRSFRKKANKLQKKLNRNKVELTANEQLYARKYYEMAIYYTAKTTLERVLELQQ